MWSLQYSFAQPGWLVLRSPETQQTMSSPVLVASMICDTQHQTSVLPVQMKFFMFHLPPQQKNKTKNKTQTA